MNFIINFKILKTLFLLDCKNNLLIRKKNIDVYKQINK